MDEIKRLCLKCRKVTFKSKSNGNRICPSCNAKNMDLARRAQEEHLKVSVEERPGLEVLRLDGAGPQFRWGETK